MSHSRDRRARRTSTYSCRRSRLPRGSFHRAARSQCARCARLPSPRWRSSCRSLGRTARPIFRPGRLPPRERGRRGAGLPCGGRGPRSWSPRQSTLAVSWLPELWMELQPESRLELRIESQLESPGVSRISEARSCLPCRLRPVGPRGSSWRHMRAKRASNLPGCVSGVTLGASSCYPSQSHPAGCELPMAC